MCAKMINKVMGFLGLEDDVEYEERDDEEIVEENNEPEEVESVFTSRKSNQNKVVNIHTATSAKVVIVKPRDYEEATNICDNLKSRKIVVINISLLETKVAQRLLDFISGSSYALGGELQEVEKGVYILSPSNVEVTNDLKSELTSKGILSWTK